MNHKKYEFSAISVTKNRFKALMVSVSSWVLQDSIEEIIVVNWDSDDFQEDLLKSLDNRIKTITVCNQKYFNLSKAYNLALDFSTKKYVIKLDADYIINPYIDLCQYINSSYSTNLDSCFITGDYAQEALDNNLGFLKYLNGLLICKKEYIINANKYQGNQYGYGYDDEDIYLRIKEKNQLCHQKLINSSNLVPIFHIPHLNEYRSMHYKEKDIEKSHKLNKEFCETRLKQKS